MSLAPGTAVTVSVGPTPTPLFCPTSDAPAADIAVPAGPTGLWLADAPGRCTPGAAGRFAPGVTLHVDYSGAAGLPDSHAPGTAPCVLWAAVERDVLPVTVTPYRPALLIESGSYLLAEGGGHLPLH